MAEIIVTIPPDGEGTTVEVEGVVGPACKDLTEGLEKSMGVVGDVDRKREFHQTVANQNRIQGG